MEKFQIGDDCKLYNKAEYIMASEEAKELVWIRKFISKLGVVSGIVDPVPLHYDNNGAIAQAKEPWSHQRQKICAQMIPLD